MTASEDVYDWGAYPGRWQFEQEAYGALREGVRELVFPLTAAASERQWDAVYGRDCDHPARFPFQTYFSRHVVLPVAWTTHWETGNLKPFAVFLDEALHLPHATTAFFFQDRHNCIQTTWGGFLQFWEAFLYADEMSLLYIPALRTEQRFELAFGSNGQVFMPPLP